jgi:hypothetical protein
MKKFLGILILAILLGGGLGKMTKPSAPANTVLPPPTATVVHGVKGQAVRLCTYRACYLVTTD